MADYDERYQVRNAEIEQKLRGIAGVIAETLPEGWGFTLLIHDFNKADGSLFYMSNGQRGDVIKTMQEFIDREVKL